MAATAWTVFPAAKQGLLKGTFNLSAGVVKLGLYTAAASAALAAGTIVTLASLTGEISARGGYVAGGRAVTGLAVGAGVSAKQAKWTFSPLTITANGSALNNIKYFVLRNSTGAGAGNLIAWSQASSAAFSVLSPNTITITVNPVLTIA